MAGDFRNAKPWAILAQPKDLRLDVVRGNQTLFMRRDEVTAAWKFIDPILDHWKETNAPPKPYTSGTWGPSQAVALIERDGRTWYEGLLA